MSPIVYMPKAFCAKCNKPADKVERVHDSRRNRRFVRVTCHRQQIEITFAKTPDETVTLWKTEN